MTPVATKGALRGFSPEVVSIVRLGVATVVFRALGGAGTRWLPADGWTWLAGFALGLDFVLYNYGLRLTTAALAGLVINVEVVAGVLLARWLLGEPLTAQRLTGAAVTLAGVLYLTGDAARLTTVFGPTTVQGNLTVMAAALAWSVYAVAQRRAPRGENLFRLLTPIFAVALLTTLPAAARPAAGEGAGGVAASGALLALTLLCTVGVYVVYGRSQDCLPMTVLTVVLATIPVFAVVFAWLLGGERLTARVLVGGAIVLAGVLVVAAEPTRALAEQLEDRDGAGEALQLRRP